MGLSIKGDMKIEINKLPPSVNHMYGRSRYGHIYLTPKGKEFKEELGWILKTKRAVFGSALVKVDLVFKISDKRKRDVDNMLKATFDALKDVIIDDDSQIMRVTATKMLGHYNKTIIYINNLDESLTEGDE